ncbi:hypothetical protein ABT282_07100 [Streptomyces sp. NPDC000927]|uniref:hypothetical protein n=1 Tax=Streptomyces sp. NPDC000927 TaxID=3154371 RepID=UPI00331772B5
MGKVWSMEDLLEKAGNLPGVTQRLNELGHDDAAQETQELYERLTNQPASGHTPDTLVEFAVQALDQGVQLEYLTDMLGSEPVPADVAAMDAYSDWAFEQLTKGGLPHAETVAVFRC